ncbi:MAG: response regulator [Chloroflexi bacterium]|nr:MAG: response regulator [Chloroflexota bacterium]
MTNNIEPDREDILVVDDTAANLRLLTRLLARHGYRVRPVADGAQALAAVEAQTPDLILLDIMMPGMNGYEVCAQLKDNPATRDIPIIFISALDDVSDKIEAFKVGGVDYITKPFQSEEVLARVRTHLTIRRLQAELQAANEALKQRNAELEQRNAELQEALNTIKTLSGIVPICAWCHSKIQEESGEWVQLEVYFEKHSEAEFTHGICPSCKAKFDAEAAAVLQNRQRG